MTERKLDNGLYIHLIYVINCALPLEYAIRATKKANPNEFQRLLEINKEVRQYWIDLGATGTEIDTESLVDFAWDTIQVGFPLTRRHGRVYDNCEFLDMIHRGLSNIRNAFVADFGLLNIPATRYFRVCDLLSGNDVLNVFGLVAQCLHDAKSYNASDEIELQKFVRGIREPIHLHPGMQYVTGEYRVGERSVEGFGLLLNTESAFSMADIKRQIREFLYQYAVRRQSLRSAQVCDQTSEALINEFLKDELHLRDHERKVTRMDGFMSVLSGLYCWDLVHQFVGNETTSGVDTAIKRTLSIYPKSIRAVGHDAIKKNYYEAKRMIDELDFTQ